jgi:hypothetical protein
MEDEKDLKQYKYGSKGKYPGQVIKNKKLNNPAGGMDVCVVFVV